MIVVVDIRTASPHFPGIGRYISGLVPALAAQLTDGERLALLCNDATQTAGFSHVLSSYAAVSTCRVRATPFSFSQQWQVARLLRQLSKNQGKSIYHSPFYLMPFRTRVPTVLTVHDLIPLLLPETVSPRARLLFRLTHRLALRTANQIIAVSDATRRDLISVLGIPETRITVIPHGVESRFRPQSQTEIDRVRTAYRLPERFILYLGINKPHKNLVNLIHAYELLPTGTPLLLIAGAWDNRYPEAKTLAMQVNLAERVRFLGPVDDTDLPGLYNAATIFVFPSRYEGFGFPVLEAMSCGTPVISSNASSLPEIVGKAAMQVDPLDSEQIAQAIHTMLASPELRESMRAAGLAQSATFSWERCATQTLATFRSM